MERKERIKICCIEIYRTEGAAYWLPVVYHTTQPNGFMSWNYFFQVHSVFPKRYHSTCPCRTVTCKPKPCVLLIFLCASISLVPDAHLWWAIRTRQVCHRSSARGRSVTDHPHAAGLSQIIRTRQVCHRSSSRGRSVTDHPRAAGLSQIIRTRQVCHRSSSRGRSVTDHPHAAGLS
jgi:hypothetical protein